MINNFQDIIPTNQTRTIRNIPLPNGKRIEIEDPHEVLSPKDNEKDTNYLFIFMFILAVLVIVFFGVIYFFGRVVVDIDKKRVDLSLPASINALKDGAKNEVVYAVLSEKISVSKEVIATEKKEVNKKASGIVIIFNNTTRSQKLVKNTRLETPEGIIFRIQDSVTIPARRLEKGAVVPGKIEVAITAEKTGELYNVGLKDFTIPGFKDDPRFKEIYARSKTAVKDGFSGVKMIADSSGVKSIRLEIEENLKKDLFNKINAQIPKDFIFISGAETFAFDDLDAVENEDGKMILSVTGTIRAFILEKQKLVNFLAKDSSVSLPENNSINLEPKDVNISKVEETSKGITLKLGGKLIVTYDLDVDNIKDYIKGKEKKVALGLVGDMVGVERVRMVLSPTWRQTIPKDKDKIIINLK